MFRIFIFGILLGIAAAAGALYAYPAVDQQREASIVSVAANGGNIESFHVNVPMDRIMVGAPGRKQALPPGMNWPTDEKLAGIRMEMFKLRNAKDIVVGVASRTSARDGSNDVIDWVLHLPARGSVYATMQADALEGGFRAGAIHAGSREFAALKGNLMERWIAETTSDSGAPTGRIELRARYVSEHVDIEPEDGEDDELFGGEQEERP